MTGLSLAFGLLLASLAQNDKGAIAEDEVSYQTSAYRKWWGQELEWRFDDLPDKGGVPAFRVQIGRAHV